jgi:hypothetical protein
VWTGFVVSWWLVPGLAMLGLSFLSSTPFRYLVLRMGLRRWGYSGRVKRFGAGEAFVRLTQVGGAPVAG